MTKAEFEAFAVVGAFEQVVIRRPDGFNEWELWAHVEGFRGNELFRTARQDRKTWVGLQTVYAEVRSMGYNGPIVVEG